MHELRNVMEKVMSVIVLATFATIVVPLLIMSVAVAVSDEGLVPGAIICLTGGVFVMVFGGIVALTRRIRVGGTRRFLGEVSSRLGSGEIATGSWIWIFATPKLRGQVDGLSYEVLFHRTGGLLSSGEPGQGLIPWHHSVRVSAPIGVRVGFGRVDAATLGASLVGLSHPVQAQGLTIWLGGTPLGEAIARQLSSQREIHEAVQFGPNGALVMVGPQDVSVSGYYPNGASAESLAYMLRLLSAIARSAASVAGGTPAA